MLMNSIQFWKIIMEEQDGPDRDEEFSELYRGIIISNILVFCLIVFTGVLFVQVTTIYVSPSIIFVLLAFFICFTHFQFTTCRESIAKIEERFFDWYSNLETDKDDDEPLDSEETKEDEEEEENYWEEDEEDTNYTSDEELSEDALMSLYKKYDLPYNADSLTIKKHFRKLAKQYHPDTPTGDSQKFIQLKNDIDIILKHTNESVTH